MSKAPKVVYIFSIDLPNGPSEVFMLPELQYLSQRETQITLFPYRKGAEAIVSLSPEITVNTCMGNYKASEHRITTRLLFTFARALMIDLLHNKGAFGKTLRSLRQTFSGFKNLYFKATHLKNCVGEFKEQAIFYSYWWEEWNLILIILKMRGELKRPHLVTRAHGFDLYTERRGGYIPFRGLQLFYTDEVFTISKNGFDYLRSRYPSFASKIRNFYLGTGDRGVTRGDSGFSEFNLASVSDFRSLKRVHLIAEILKHVPHNITWTHVGGGEGLEEFREKLSRMELPANIRYELTGYKKNDEVYEMYKNREFHLFINVSSVEGLPISIMEATSMGIPAVATNVGGTSEIVDERTGILIERDFDPVEVAGKISAYLLSLKTDASYKERVRAAWREKFLNTVTNKNFADHLLSA